MNWLEALETLEATKRGKQRTEKLAELMEQVPELHIVMKYALSPDITFGVKKLPEREAPSKAFLDDDFAFWVEELLEPLAKRELTGKKAQAEIKAYFYRITDLAYRWLYRVLKQDLKLSIDARTVNAVRPGTIDLFEVSLAKPFKEAKDKHLEGTWVAQPKADGGRAVAILPPGGGEVKMYSRTGKEWLNFESVRLELQVMNERRNGSDTLYLDGEVVSWHKGRIDFQAVQRTMMAKKRATEIGTLQFLVFDGATESEWFSQKMAYSARWCFASSYLADMNANPQKVDMLPNLAVWSGPTREQVNALHDEQVKLGWEGLMIRRSDIPTVFDRDWSLLKVKAFETDEAKVIGRNAAIFTDEIDGVPTEVETLGALVVEMKDGTQFEVGSGFSRLLRDELWACDLDDIVGLWVAFNYFEWTNDHKPRHPTFKFFRDVDDM